MLRKQECNASPIAIHCVSVLFKSPHLSLCMRRSVMVYKDLRPKGRLLGQTLQPKEKTSKINDRNLRISPVHRF